MKETRVPSIRTIVVYSIVCGALSIPIIAIIEAATRGSRSLGYTSRLLPFEVLIFSPMGIVIGFLAALAGQVARNLGASRERTDRTESRQLGAGLFLGMVICYLCIALFVHSLWNAWWEVLLFSALFGAGGYVLSQNVKVNARTRDATDGKGTESARDAA